jgi:hypothetical protein
MTENNFRCTVFPGLNILSEMAAFHASISKIAYFEMNIFLEIDVIILPLKVFQLLWGILYLYFIFRV